MKYAHFTSSPLSRMKSPKSHLILIQSKISLGYIKTLALGWYSQNFSKSYRVVFEKCSLVLGVGKYMWNYVKNDLQITKFR